MLAALLPDAEGHNDDVTLLLTRLPDAPLAAVSTDLPAIPDSVPEGRAFLGKALTSWDCTGGRRRGTAAALRDPDQRRPARAGTHRPAPAPHRHRSHRRGQRPQPPSAPAPARGRGRGVRQGTDPRPRPRRQLGSASHRRGQDHLVHARAAREHGTLRRPRTPDGLNTERAEYAAPATASPAAAPPAPPPCGCACPSCRSPTTDSSVPSTRTDAASPRCRTPSPRPPTRSGHPARAR